MGTVPGTVQGRTRDLQMDPLGYFQWDPGRDLQENSEAHSRLDAPRDCRIDLRRGS